MRTQLLSKPTKKKKIIIGSLVLATILAICFLNAREYEFFSSKSSSDYLQGEINQAKLGEIQEGYIGESGTGWSFNIKEDEKQEVEVDIQEVDEDIIEITLHEHPNSLTAGSYEWDMALCNSENINPKFIEEDARGQFKETDWSNVIQKDISDEGLNEKWCSDTGSGYVLVSKEGKDKFEKKMRINVSGMTEFTLYAGSGSVVIDADGSSIASAYGENENICINSTGGFNVAYEGGDSDLWYAWSSDSGATWSSKEIHAGTITQAGIVCSPNDDLYIYYMEGYDVDMYKSTDAGSSWTGPTAVEDDVDGFDGSLSAVVDSSNVVHWCVIDNDDDVYYMNSSSLNDALLVSSDNSAQCDIEVDNDNNVYIVISEALTDDLDIMTNADSWASRNSVNDNLGSGSGTLGVGVSIAIDDNDNIHLAGIFGGDLQYCNGTTSDLTTWSCAEIDSDDSYNPDIIVTEANEVFILYQSAYTIAGKGYRANSSDWVNWDVRQEVADSFISVAQSMNPSTNKVIETLYYVYTDGDGIHYNSFSVKALADSLNISYPTTSTNLTTSNASSETLAFDLFRDSTPITTGVTIESVFIGGSEATIKTKTTTENTGKKDPTANEDDYTQWSSFERVYSSDDSRAYESSIGHMSDAYNFSLNVPEGAGIKGIEIFSETSGDYGQDYILEVELSWDGGTSYTSQNKQNTVYGTTDTIKTFGNSTDTWGRTWNSSEFSNDNFRVRVEHISGGNNHYLDHLQARVYYEGEGDQFAHNGTDWVVNVTMPDKADGTYDLFINATYSGTTYSDNETSAIVYGTGSPPPSNCWTEEAGKIIIPPSCKYYTNVKEGIVPS